MLIFRLMTAVMVCGMLGISALPAGDSGCKGLIKCLYETLQSKETVGVSQSESNPASPSQTYDGSTITPPPAEDKRMFDRHGKRGMSEPMVPGHDIKRLYIEREIDEMLQKRRQPPEYREDDETKQINSLSSQIRTLQNKVADIKVADTSEEPEVDENESLRIQINAVQADINKLNSLLQPEVVPTTPAEAEVSTESETHSLESQQLRLLSKKLAELDNRKESEPRSRATAPSGGEASTQTNPDKDSGVNQGVDGSETSLNINELSSKLDRLTQLVYDTIEVNKLAYQDLDKKLEVLSQKQPR